MPAFGGGTSLSKGWGLIKRFSEDIDFKVAMPARLSRNKARNERSAYRERILAALTEADFILAGEPAKGDENHFFSADFFYPSLFDTGPGLRPHIRVEMTLQPPALPPVARPIASLIGMAQQKPPEVAAFLCVDPVETAADKLSALAWRVHARQRGSEDDDPTIIRHLHDLAALKETVTASSDFPRLVQQGHVRRYGQGRGGDRVIRSRSPFRRHARTVEHRPALGSRIPGLRATGFLRCPRRADRLQSGARGRKGSGCTARNGRSLMMGLPPSLA